MQNERLILYICKGLKRADNNFKAREFSNVQLLRRQT